DLGVRRQDQDPGRRELRPDLPGRIEALAEKPWRHPDIDDGQVRIVLADEGEQPWSIMGLADDVESGSFQQARDALPPQRLVVRQAGPLALIVHHVSSPSRSAEYPWPDYRPVTACRRSGHGGHGRGALGEQRTRDRLTGGSLVRRAVAVS